MFLKWSFTQLQYLKFKFILHFHYLEHKAQIYLNRKKIYEYERMSIPPEIFPALFVLKTQTAISDFSLLAETEAEK